ncbi:class I SAM-dependent methyltransferase [bacterium]|nr:MAG: class I SAM-dependent methyltransferase [bacterium]
MKNNLYLNPKSAKEFSDSRYAPWQGWYELMPYFNIIQADDTSKPLPTFSHLPQGMNKNILDIGSGNGRFLNFLIDNNISFENYTGIDYSDTLLEISKEKFNLPNVKFLKQDFTSESWEILQDQKFDIKVGFGVTHHLESETARDNFFKNIKNHSKNGTLLILSFWEFWKIPRLMKKAIEISPNLYKLAFGNNEAERICYKWEEEDIEKYFVVNNFQIEKEFEMDWNRYFILSSITS